MKIKLLNIDMLEKDNELRPAFAFLRASLDRGSILDLKKMGSNVSFLTGSNDSKDKKTLVAEIAEELPDIVVRQYTSSYREELCTKENTLYAILEHERLSDMTEDMMKKGALGKVTIAFRLFSGPRELSFSKAGTESLSPKNISVEEFATKEEYIIFERIWE